VIASALAPAGPQAARIAGLWWLMFWTLSVVFVLVLVTLAWAIARRRRSIADPVGAAETRAGRGTALAVGGGVAVTVVVLFVLLIASVATSRGLSSLQAHDPLTVEIVGHQWWWEVHYDAPVASDRVTTANEVHVPLGRPVLVTLRSPDVIHSFWVPNLHGKRDLIPGQANTLWLQADRPGVFRAPCAEFCGLQHAHMALVVVAETAPEFEAWMSRQRRPAPEPADAGTRRGRDVFLSAGCDLCHAIRGTDAAATVAPDLTHVASRLTLAAGTLPNTKGHLAGWILDPPTIKPGTQMPGSTFAPQDFQALLAYLETLR
jgi:cytochrome c oxidase subunit II